MMEGGDSGEDLWRGREWCAGRGPYVCGRSSSVGGGSLSSAGRGSPMGVIVIWGGVSSSVCGASSSAGGAFMVGYRRPCMGIVVRRWGIAFRAWGSSLSVGGGSLPVVA